MSLTLKLYIVYVLLWILGILFLSLKTLVHLQLIIVYDDYNSCLNLIIKISLLFLGTLDIQSYLALPEAVWFEAIGGSGG